MLLTKVAFSVISIMLYYMQKYMQTERIWQGLVARDFDSNEGLEVKEYFVYFELTNRTVGAKDPSIPADKFSMAAIKETGEDNVQRTHQTPGPYHGVRRGADT